MMQHDTSSSSSIRFHARSHTAIVTTTLLIFGSASFIAGCERTGIEEQDVAKGVEDVPPATVAGEEPQARASDPDKPWIVPDGWTEDPAPRPMRLTTYIAPDPSGDVEVAVSRFGGRVGGELANINRWRGQMGLAPVAPDELESFITRFESEGFDGYETRIESERGVMLASGVYQSDIDQTWFVRATLTDTDMADRVQPDVFGMARSIAELNDPGDG